MFKKSLSRQWICSRCIQQQRQVRRRLGTISAIRHEPRPVPIDNAAPGAKHDDRTLRSIFDSPGFWNEFSYSARQGHKGRSLGLFQNRYLTEPQGFKEFANVSMEKAKRIVERIRKASSVEEYKRVVRDMDRLGDLLCRVVDISDFVRVTHPDPRIQTAATEAYGMMFEFMNILNTTTDLNSQLTVAMQMPEVIASWSQEEACVAETLRTDFVKSAIDLPRAERERFVTLSQEISEAGPTFVDNMAPERAKVSFPSSRLKGMDPVLVRQLTKWGQTSIPTLGSPATLALRTVQDEDVRKDIYMAIRTSSRQTIERLEDLLTKRVELAKLSKYESYAHLALGDKMAKTPESVDRFLQALSAENKKSVELEMSELVKAKTSDSNALTSTLQAWDRGYYTTQILSSFPSRTRKSDFLSSYFSLGTVMQGLSRLFTHLYGIRFVPHETMPGETWNSDVRRLDVVSETDGHVAVLYCDLFSRHGKSPNPAHFTLRCSREITQIELEEAKSSNNTLFASPEESANDGMAFSASSGVLKQLPTIALICDFATSPDKRPSLLSFNEVQTLFHEMGHAIHSILGRTSFQTVSGTRCATDFAELPSVLMEHFAADPTVLALFARHYQTDEPLPHGLVAERLILNKRFEGADAEDQILLSMVDQAYHSSLPLQASFNTTQIFLDIQREHGVLPPDPPGTSWQGFFGHLFGYGSSYYSYLFDRVLAKRIWRVVFKSGHASASIDRGNGERMKESVLKWGGSRDPWKCLAEVLQDSRVEGGDEKAMGLVGSWGLKEREGER
ncbi:hypothetical protein B7494_g6692 [Chlorociboria aeruginascens]|nr:hypothetical protein B7494_g6692 [Chlorociboria aeruginascens]